MFKRVVKTSLRHIGYDLVQYVETPERPFQVLPYLVAEQLAKHPNFFFVQIGAHDGVLNNPLRELILQYGLPGLFVEQLSDQFERLRANYANQPGVAFERCAVGREDGQASIYRVRADAPLPRWVLAVASFNRDHLSEENIGVSGVERYVEEIRVPCLTLPSLLRQRGIQSMTLLQVDAEDFGCEIVRMALEAGLRPSLVNYASRHPAPSDRATCKRRLMEAGYCFIDIGADTLAVRR
jgi:FkbM family methyltransferase